VNRRKDRSKAADAGACVRHGDVHLMSKALQFVQQFFPLILREHATSPPPADRQPAVPLDRAEHPWSLPRLRTSG
jgi:hypothetical protein